MDYVYDVETGPLVAPVLRWGRGRTVRALLFFTPHCRRTFRTAPVSNFLVIPGQRRTRLRSLGNCFPTNNQWIQHWFDKLGHWPHPQADLWFRYLAVQYSGSN